MGWLGWLRWLGWLSHSPYSDRGLCSPRSPCPLKGLEGQKVPVVIPGDGNWASRESCQHWGSSGSCWGGGRRGDPRGGLCRGGFIPLLFLPLSGEAHRDGGGRWACRGWCWGGWGCRPARRGCRRCGRRGGWGRTPWRSHHGCVRDPLYTGGGAEGGATGGRLGGGDRPHQQVLQNLNHFLASFYAPSAFQNPPLPLGCLP